MNVHLSMSPGGPPLPGPEKFAHLRAMCVVLIDRSLKTLRAVPDPHARFLRGPQSSLPLVLDAREAYGWDEVRRPKFQPTSHDVTVYLDVLTTLLPYLESLPDGTRMLRVVLARAYGAAYWKIAWQLGGGSDANVRRLWSVAIDAMTRKHWALIERWAR